MTERLPMTVRVLLGLGVTIIAAGVVCWHEFGPAYGAAIAGIGALCVVAGVVRWRRVPPPPPHSIHEELQEAYEARELVGAIVAAVIWTGAVVALFVAGEYVIGAVLLGMLILAPLLAYYLATSATRTHRRRRSRAR